MNPHNQNHYGLARAADLALMRIMLIALFGAICGSVGFVWGEQRGFKEGVVSCPKPVKSNERAA